MSAKRALTVKRVAAIKPPANGQKDHFDAALPGFALRVSSKGTKSFVLFYRSKVGPKAGKQLVSEPVFKLGLAGRPRSTFGWRIAQAIRNEPGSHSVKLVPAPHPSVDILEDPGDKTLPKIYADIMKTPAAEPPLCSWPVE